MPQWIFALVALCIVATMNLIGVKWFAEMEFWFALIKVAAIVLFLMIGAAILGTGMPVSGHGTGLHLITDNGGFFPHGLMPALVLVQGVVFAFAGVELVGTAAGECKDARSAAARDQQRDLAHRDFLRRIGRAAGLPAAVECVQGGPGSFVTFFGALGVPGIGSVMNWCSPPRCRASIPACIRRGGCCVRCRWAARPPRSSRG